MPLLEASPGRFLPNPAPSCWYLRGGSDARSRQPASTRRGRCNGCSSSNTASSPISAPRISGSASSRAAASCSTDADERVDGARLPGAFGVMEKHLAIQRFLRRRPLHHRRHRALRLHAHRQRVRLRPHRLSRRSALGSSASPRPGHIAHEVAPDGDGGAVLDSMVQGARSRYFGVMAGLVGPAR